MYYIIILKVREKNKHKEYIKPILKDEGLLSFNFIYPQNTENKEEENENTEILESTKPIVENISKNEKIFVYIDDNLISDFSKPIFLIRLKRKGSDGNGKLPDVEKIKL